MEKKIIIMGGIGKKWGKQYHQQDRVYCNKGIFIAVEATRNGLVIKKWKKES